MGLLKRFVGCILLTIMLAVIASAVFNYMGNIFDYDEPVEVNLSLTVPDVPTYSPHKFENKPVAKARSGNGFSLSIESMKSEFYEYYGGIIKIWVENKGSRPLFIYEYGIKPDFMPKNEWRSSSTGKRVDPGEKRLLGLRNLGATSVVVEDGVMTYTAKYGFSLMERRDDGKWYDHGTVFTDPLTIEVKPAIKDTEKEYVKNPRFLFNEINRLVNSSDPGVIKIEKKISDRYPQGYNMYQVCALFDYVSGKIEYLPDPEDLEVWQRPDETLQLGRGDCEDYAILMASLIEAAGGNARIYLTEDHAFAAVYIGNETVRIDEAIRTYYNTPATVYFITDDYGSWLILDTVSGFYTGNLPVGAKPSEMDWNFENTNTITIIDIV
ncbi:MAG: transglutaminase family protein [Halobacteriota archaeon]|nr:transglutaminase family protein [Halobacteriota archaeon]